MGDQDIVENDFEVFQLGLVFLMRLDDRLQKGDAGVDEECGMVYKGPVPLLE